MNNLWESSNEEPPPTRPLTRDVLLLVGNQGVVVGSVARGAPKPKDLDIVVRPQSFKETRHPFFAKLLATFPASFLISCAPGHLMVLAKPLNVEFFEDNDVQVTDPVKREQQVSYRQARRGAQLQSLFGVLIMVQSVEKGNLPILCN